MATTFTQKRCNRPTVKHLSHCHALCPFEAKDEDEIICSGCELDLMNSSAFKCTKSNYDFFLHKECFQLPGELWHKFHHDHPLKILFSPPYTEGRFTCNACGDYGTAFTYQCTTCKCDLHVGYANMSEILKRKDHEHLLTLFNSSSCNRGYTTFTRSICKGDVPDSCWVFYCPDCDYGTDLGCASVESKECQEEAGYAEEDGNQEDGSGIQ